MLFHHPSPPLPSQVGQPERLADILLPCLAAQLTIYHTTESPQSTGSQAVPATSTTSTTSHQFAMCAVMWMPRFTSSSGLGCGGVSPALPYTHHWPCTPTLPLGLERNAFLVQRVCPNWERKEQGGFGRGGGKGRLRLSNSTLTGTTPPSSLSCTSLCLFFRH